MDSYSIPRECSSILKEGILNNPKIKRVLPVDIERYVDSVSFRGSDLPSLPINWRYAESISTLKATEALVLNVLLAKKYGLQKPPKVEINTDHAQLFIFSPILWTLDPAGEKLSFMSTATPEGRQKLYRYFADYDVHGAGSSPYMMAVTNMFRTKDNRWFHLHGSLDSRPSLRSIGLPDQNSTATEEEALSIIGEAAAKFTAEELQYRETVEFKQAGTICFTKEEFAASEHGKANEHTGLFELRPQSNEKQLPSWWIDSPMTSPRRPLAGLKVVELTRIIAGPTIARGLAELGASVMRITAPHIPDVSSLHPDLNHGKWNASLDLRKEEDREKLRRLILDADVIVDGYRPHVFAKYGFSEKDILEIVEDRQRGIIFAHENCYGWNGPWKDRSGWQQISDACTGVDFEFGRAMGLAEPVTPLVPNSDFCTGAAGITAVMCALIHKAEHGGSVSVDLGLNYYNSWLINSVGMYPNEVWQDVWQRNGRHVYRATDNSMFKQLPLMTETLNKGPGRAIFDPSHFTQYDVKNLGTAIRFVAPVLRFPDGPVEPGFQVGTRGNGIDKPHWPKDLSVEVVT
ncbi:hypothetical protein AMS68_006579 [Peltaster fructicola]|uniref:Uncharacterized protein n=1 Tax=Peltaster fructicola TaxID=286661 RepID=A0A6H0Y218_9PEZI|nr:hypothetical protein AMS68_006579 [Peltaster fructicola]